MTDRDKTTWKVFFFFTGLWNIGLGLYFMFDLERGMESFTTYRTAEPHTLFVFFLMWMVLAALGLSFWQITYNLRSNRAFLYLITVGKVAICIILAFGYLKDLVSLLGLLIGAGDFLWAVFIAMFLYQSREFVQERV